MKHEFIRRFLLWFVSGFGLTAGVLVAVVAAEFIKPSFRDEPEIKANNGELKVTRIEPLSITTSAGALVSIANTASSGELKPRDIELVFKHGGKTLFWCSQYVSRQVAAGKTIVEQMLCDKVERALLPEGTEYVVNIKRFEKWK